MISKSLFYGMGDYFGSTRKNTCKSELVKIIMIMRIVVVN